MRIEHRQIGEAFVVDLKGSATDLADLDGMLRLVNSALENGIKSIVLNLAHLSYINSTGLGRIVRSYSNARTAGARLVLCHPSKRVIDLFSITKLLTLFETYESIDEALRYSGSLRLQVTCPSVGPERWIRFLPLNEYQCCPLCGLELKVSSPVPNTSTPVTGRVTAFRLPTYEGERISAVMGEPTLVSIDGRLDLFAAEAIEHAMHLIPAPYCLVLSLGTNDISEIGMASLIRLCHVDAASRVAISLNGVPGDEKQRWREEHTALIHNPDEEAARAIEPWVPPGTLTVRVRSRDL